MSSIPRRRPLRPFVASLVVAVVALVSLPPSALAGGRLIETGHDADWRCAVSGTQCHFLQVAVGYVRNGAPDPSRKLLVIDDGDLLMRRSLINAFGADIVNHMDVVDPKTAQFRNATLSPSVYSAIVVASDQTCGKDDSPVFAPHGPENLSTSYCDLNRPASGWPPPVVGDPGTLTDSTAIVARSGDIKAFFDAGGGVFVGSGADNGDGHSGDKYYSFIELPGGAEGSACKESAGLCVGGFGALELTPAGRAIGFTDGGGGAPDDITCGLSGSGCASHNSFLRPRVGSQLRVAETGPDRFETTLFEDAQAPDTIVTGGPGPTLGVAAPAPPVPVLASGEATIAFRASEDTTSFACALDSGAASPCSSPRSLSGLSGGVHRLSVTATDAGGNLDPTPAEIVWLVASDADHDGYLQSNPFGPADCNDGSASIHPGASEVLGNRVDENCDQTVGGFARLRPTFAVRVAPGTCRRCLHFTRLITSAAPAGATVRLRCSGPRCRFTRTVQTRRSGERVNLLRSLPKRGLPPRTTVEITVTAPQMIGVVKRLQLQRSKSGTQIREVNRCVVPGAKVPARQCLEIE